MGCKSRTALRVVSDLGLFFVQLDKSFEREVIITIINVQHNYSQCHSFTLLSTTREDDLLWSIERALSHAYIDIRNGISYGTLGNRPTYAVRGW